MSGRTPLPESERKRNNLTFRLRDGLRTDLVAEASANGRSLSEEVEFRLELSFRDDNIVERLRAIMRSNHG